MFQKFNTDTLFSRYIKSLLAQTAFPLFDAVVDGDYLVKGCYYIYKNFVIKCVSTGVIRVKDTAILYPSTTVYPSIVLVPGTGEIPAKFTVEQYVNTEDITYCSTYTSINRYYDSDTHYQLGRYLRYLHTTTGLNLLPFYNVYSAKHLPDVELIYNSDSDSVVVQRTEKQTARVVAIPIVLGKTYTVALDCPTPVLMRACIYDNSGYVDETILHNDVQLDLSRSARRFESCSFKNPIKFTLYPTSKQIGLLQKNLYLVIQIPLNNDSTITVLENFTEKQGIHCNSEYVREYDLVNPALLQMNYHVSYAFSDRLIEYLLNNVIHEGTEFSKNIAKVQNVFAHIAGNEAYRDAFIRGDKKYGIWDQDISRLVIQLVQKQTDVTLVDQDGNINKDFETILQNKGGLY